MVGVVKWEILFGKDFGCTCYFFLNDEARRLLAYSIHAYKLCDVVSVYKAKHTKHNGRK